MYSNSERSLARFLDSFPRLRQVAKGVYQRVNYYASARHPAKSQLVNNCHMQVVLGDKEGEVQTFFGYFGTSPWSSDGKYFVLHAAKADSTGDLEVVLQNRTTGETCSIGKTRAWNYQQGSMAQWIPKRSKPTIIYNDQVGTNLGARIVSLQGEQATLSWPVQALHPDGREAVSINYRRLWRLRPEYGYDVEVVNMRSRQASQEDGIWAVDLETGGAKLIVCLKDLIDNDYRTEMKDSEHKVNHVVYSPRGKKMVFMHRWLGPQGKFSRLYSCNPDGTDLRLLLDHRMVSHYTWRDDETLLVWARKPETGDGYYLLSTLTGESSVFGNGALNAFGDGHPTFSPDHRWLVTDTYPDRNRHRHLLLYSCDEQIVRNIGSFFSPWKFDGAMRCDLHPRWSPDGRCISIDSAHDGRRGSYIVDVSKIVSQ